MVRVKSITRDELSDPLFGFGFSLFLSKKRTNGQFCPDLSSQSGKREACMNHFASFGGKMQRSGVKY
jgi:hypothetical protein